MANLKEVRERINSVSSTQQITNAMKMVSAAKLRRASEAIERMRPYERKLAQMLQNVVHAASDGVDIGLAKSREIEKVLMVVMTSNRGLCGAFNSNIIKQAAQKIEEDYKEIYKNGNLHILCIGKKGNDYFKKRYPEAVFHADHVEIVKNLKYDTVRELVDSLIDQYTQSEFDRIDIAYGRFKNAAMQFPELNCFAPIQPPTQKAGKDMVMADYIYEPDQVTLLKDLVPMIMRTQFYRYILDTHASEHGARMTAMDKASENAEELKKELRITYNKARQEAITKELSEIVGGAAALGG